MRFWLFAVLFVFASEIATAQTFNLSDSLSHVFRQRITPSFKFDTRNSFITGSSSKIYGIKAGVNFGKRLSVGIGYNFIGTELKEDVLVNDQKLTADIRMNYVAPFIEYSFYQRGPWELITPIQFGVGNSAGTEGDILDYNFPKSTYVYLQAKEAAGVYTASFAPPGTRF
jgi:hypothetical protein